MSHEVLASYRSFTSSHFNSGLDSARLQAEAHIAIQLKGKFSFVASRAKGWMRRGAIETEVNRLEKNQRSCRLRFITSASARTECNAIVHHQEQMDHLLHMEDLVSYMIVHSQTFPPLHVYEPDEINWQFIHRQVLRISSELERRKGTGTHLSAMPMQDFEEQVGVHLTTGANFQAILSLALDTVNAVHLPAHPC
ncbi:hypothetical protein HGRIS_001113 [Hohenbuehelia grisea]|uniref:Uncharacterized protein n=1 Tax=Hohenbuehelia grisea TaxID=104357 RepID=A0ABR3JPN1_9AGAR